jgi:multidrug transporter EmrE-like cation transporter
MNDELNRYIVKTFTITLNYAIFGGVCVAMVYMIGTLPFEDELREKVVMAVIGAGGPIITMMQLRKKEDE